MSACCPCSRIQRTHVSSKCSLFENFQILTYGFFKTSCLFEFFEYKMAGVLFEDIFNVKDIDPDGKQFDRGKLTFFVDLVSHF